MRTAKGQISLQSTQSDQDFPCQPTESLDMTECMNGQQRPRWYFVHVQDGLKLRILHMFEGTFLFDIASLITMYFGYFLSQAKKFVQFAPKPDLYKR